MSQSQPYATRTVYWLLAVGVLSFAAAAWFMIFSDSDVGAPKANAYSYSAIGHRALVETLRATDVPVLVSRANSAEKAGGESLLVVAEPRLADWYDGTIGADPDATDILVVLPKWDGLRDQLRPHWLSVSGMIPRSYVQSILREMLPDASLFRTNGRLEWDTGPLGVDPDIDYPQLIESDELNPTIWSDQGILAGWVDYGARTVWILSDPDILSNHGLARGDNAVLTLRLLDSLRPLDGAVVFDETVHGYWQPPNLWRNMLQLPFVVPVILAAVAALMVGWAATGRFGSPLPPKPPFASGKAVLIDNTASLLRFGGHGSEILRRYAEVTLRNVAHRLNAPRNLDGEALIDWVDRVGQARGVKRSFRELAGRIDKSRNHTRRDGAGLARMARRLYQWRREMIDGS
jgi:hypothetical protein